MGYEAAARRDWTVQPKAEALLGAILDEALSGCADATRFRTALLDGCAIRLRDILDHVGFSDQLDPARAEAAGWAAIEPGLWRHPDGYFPDLVRREGPIDIAFRVESVERLATIAGSAHPIEGARHGPYRRVVAFTSAGTRFIAVERNGHAGHDLPTIDAATIRRARLHAQAFRTRRRQFDTPDQGFDHTDRLVDAAVAEIGPHWACQLFFAAEREYWIGRCDAGRLQKARQDACGVGWCNIDHDTYDSSRELFGRAIAVLERLGYVCRELFYAGHEAGWGSQILEQPVLRSTIFADIDLAPDELDIDFAHRPLAPLPRLRRAGLWCAMHGESMLQAGLNHVAGMYDQSRFRRQMAGQGVAMMKPFSSFPHLYQELTEGQWWPVDPARIDRIEQDGHLTAAEAEDFRLNGAIAAHLENLERNQGYKGFNQPGINGVLRIIDPRRNRVEAG